MHLELLEWFIENMYPEEFRDKRVLDVGSRCVNGSVRPIVEKFCKPREYIGVDIEDVGVLMFYYQSRMFARISGKNLSML